MATNPTVLAIQAKIDGLKGLNQLKTALRGIGTQAKNAENDLTGLTKDIVDFGKATGNSINSLEAQKRAFEALRRSVDFTSKEFKEATAEIAKLDRQLAKAEGRRGAGGVGGRLRGAAQISATAAGAGVFGGPEGFLGAIGGGIFGGPGGAIVGAAFGAQIGQLRKAAGGVAEYVAELNLAKATLAGVSTDQIEYNQNLEFARKISGNYAIRLKDVITGYASVTAAAKANNLSVKETQTIYEGITASGIAFGKSQEDLQALFLATTQVLSKGKASAEEISGQIGERIPGAVAKFAEATKRSLPELAKAFKDGKVTIADFVRFAQKQGDDYAEFAQSLADGPEKAGLRLQIALDNASEKFGGFFLDIGAGFQDYLTNLVNFVVENEKQFKLLIAKTVVFAEDFVNIFVEIGKGIWRVFGPLFKLIGDTIVGLTQGLADLVKQGQIERAAREKGIGRGQSFELRRKAEAEIAREEGGRNVFDIGQSERINQRYFEKLAQLAGITTGPTTRANRIAAILKKFDEFTPERFGGVQTGGGVAPSGETESPSGKGKDPMVAARRQFASEFAGMERSFAEVARLRLAKTTADLELQIIKAQKDQNKELEFSLKQKLQLAKVDITIEGLTAQIASRESKIAQGKLKNIDMLKYEDSLTRDKNSLLIAQTEKNKILAEQDKDRFLFNQKTTEEIQKQTKAIEDARFALREQFGLVSPEEKVARAQREFKQKYPGATDQDLDLIRQQIDPTTFEKVQQNISGLKKELEGLVNFANQITGAANAIGDAFSQSFINAITGATTAKQALADFFKSVASYFLDMAKQIIAKMITIAILNAVVGLLPGGGGGGGGDLDIDAVSQYSGIGANTRIPTPTFRANGGPVNANQPYIVGERGPELFIPFQQGSITSNEAMQQASMAQLPFTRSAESISQAMQTAQAMQAAGPINVKYESTVINGVEYVTAEQHRKGMAQAAERGRALTLQTLQNSPKTRSKVGI